VGELSSYKVIPYGERKHDADADLLNFCKVMDYVLNLAKANAEMLLNTWDEKLMPDEFLKLLAGTLGIEYEESLPRADREAIVKQAIGCYRLKGTIWAIRFLIRKLLRCRPIIEDYGTQKCVLIFNNPVGRFHDQNDLASAQSIGTSSDVNDYFYSPAFVDGRVIIRITDFSGNSDDEEVIKYLIREYLGPGPYEIVLESHLLMEQGMLFF